MRWDRVVMGATLIAIGVLFLLDRADVLDAGKVIGDWWPVVLVGFGLVTLAERPVSLLGPVLLVTVGVLLLLVTNDVLETSAWNVIWPTALIAIGLTVLFRNRGRGDHLVLGEGHDQDLVRTTAFLSGWSWRRSRTPSVGRSSPRSSEAWSWICATPRSPMMGRRSTPPRSWEAWT